MTRDALAASLSRRVARDAVLCKLRDRARAREIEVCVVGGFVRDVALGRRPGDVDLVSGRGTRRLLEEITSCWGRRGFRFRKRGVTTWRFTIEGRPVDLVDAARRGIVTDLRRRDLTLNAMAFDLARGKLVDPCGGLADLRNRRLRLPRPGVIVEDPLRALRVARFLAELPDSRAVPAVRREAARVVRGLSRVAAERVRHEFDRLLAGPEPHRGLRFLDRLCLTDAVLPELAALRDCTAGGGRPDVWTHTVAAIERSTRPTGLPGKAALRDASGRRLLRWALLLHDLAKPETLQIAEDGRPTFHGHEVRGARRAGTLMQRLRLPRPERRRIRRLILFHLRPSQLAEDGAPPRGTRRLVREAGDDLPLLVVHAACDALASGGPADLARWARLRRLSNRLLAGHRDATRRPLSPLIDGDDVMRKLGIPAGPEVGRLLERIRDLQEQGALATRDEALRRLARVRDQVSRPRETTT